MDRYKIVLIIESPRNLQGISVSELADELYHSPATTGEQEANIISMDVVSC